MATPSPFFADDTPHGRIKRVILKKFLQAFVPISYHRTIGQGKKIDGFVIIDGFAGEGKYGKKWSHEIDQYGSPLISLMVTLNFYYKKKNNNQDKVWNFGDESERRELIFEEDIEADIFEHAFISTSMASLSFENRKIFNMLVKNVDQDNVWNFGDESSGRIELILEEDIEADIFEHEFISTSMASLIFVEKDQKIFNMLVKNVDTIFNVFGEVYTVRTIGSRGFIMNATNISCTIINCSFADFSESFPEESLHRRACFTFVDPFGYSQTPMKSIEKFLGGKNKTFLMNFMSGYVNRCISKEPGHIAKLYGIELPQTSDSKIDPGFVCYLKKGLRSMPPGYTSTSGNIQNCAIHFQRALEQNSREDLSIMFEMRGKRNVPIYHLVFVTGHKSNYINMKEAMNRCTQYKLEMKFSDYDIIRKGHIVNLSNRQDNTKVADVIFEKYKGQRISIERIGRYILFHTPFVFRKKALYLMETEDNPRITRVEGGPRKLFTYPDHKKWILTFRM